MSLAQAKGFDEDGDTLTVESFLIRDLFAQFDQLSLGPADAPLVRFDNPYVGITALDTRGRLRLGEILFGADEAALFAGASSSGFNFNAVTQFIDGSIDPVTGAFDISALRGEMNISDVISLVTGDVSIGWDPAETNPNATLAQLGSATLAFPAWPQLPSAEINGLTIRRDGFDLDDFVVDIPSELFGGQAFGAALAAIEGGSNLDPEIEGRVWFDVNGDGLQSEDLPIKDSDSEEDEPGVPDVVVRLLDSQGTPLAETMTDDDGNYLFEDVPAGDYQVQIIGPTGTQFVSLDQGGDEDVDSDVSADGLTAVFTHGDFLDTDSLSDAGLINIIERPLLIVPGIAGTFAADTLNTDSYRTWLTTRGIHPDFTASDPLTKVNDDLMFSLDHAGYTVDKDLFVVTYDWRLPPGPSPTASTNDLNALAAQLDGKITGLQIEDVVNGERFDYAVDYIGYFIDRAAKQWAQDHGGAWPESVDIVAHSTGGLVTRTYIQAEGVYGAMYDHDGDDRTAKVALPKINTFVSVGVPHRGASKAWNPLHDEWGIEFAYSDVLAKIIEQAYQKHLQQPILGPSGDPNGADAIAQNQFVGDGGGFAKAWVPTMRSLLATYENVYLLPNGEFRDGPGGKDDYSIPIDQANLLGLDLNAGLDLPGVRTTDRYHAANAFIDNIEPLRCGGRVRRDDTSPIS